MSNRDEAIWLVKFAAKISGPISQNEILNRLKSRALNFNDEASSPGRRWQQLQSHPALRDIFEEARRMLVSEETEGTWTPNLTNATQTLTDFSESEMTEEISNGLGGLTRTAEIVIEDMPEEKRGGAKAVAARFQTNALSQNPALIKKVDRATKWLWLLTGLVLVAGGWFVWQKKSGPEVRPINTEALRAEIPAVIQTGDFETALAELKTVFPDALKSGEMGFYMAPLLIQVENQTVLGKRLLTQLMDTHQGDAKLELTAMGIADLIENQIDSARQHFEQALAIDSSYVPAIINSGITQVLQSHYAQAKAAALKAIQLNPAEGEAQILLAESAVYLKSAPDFELALDQLTGYRAHQMDYEPEALFYTIYLNWLKNDHKVEDEMLDQFLELDPQLTSDHRHNVFIYRGRTQWNVLGRFCQQIADQFEASARTSMLKAVCFSKEGRKVEARTWIEKAVAQSPLDPLVQTWYSYILNENGMGDQASVALGRAGELNHKYEYTLPTLMQARFCQLAGDFDCANQGWQRLFSQNERSISALGGLATTFAARNNLKEAAIYADRGLKVSSDYIPLLKLKLRAEKEGWYGRN